MKRTYIGKGGYPRFKSNKKLVHREVARKKVGGTLFRGVVVHHKDGNKSNFRRSNLRVMKRSSHSRLHAKKRKKKSFW